MSRGISRIGFGLAVTLVTHEASAQLVDASQVTPTVPGGVIEKSLDEQIGAGHGDEQTPGSAVYLIRRDPARSIRRGRQLFQRKFTRAQGLGPRVSPDSTGDIAQNPALGAGLVDSCAGCHALPRGAAGFGGDVATRPDSRNAPHLFGLGLQEMLADEMTAELRQIRDEALASAGSGSGVVETLPAWVCRVFPRYCEDLEGTGGDVSRDLVAKGIYFGRITARSDGSLDTSRVEGVDADLRVRPFFHHGGTTSIREFVVGALKDEMGLEAVDPVLCSATEPGAPLPVVTPAGMVLDPTLDTIQRPPTCGASEDGDGDGVANEIDAALVDHLEFYLLNYFKPASGRQTRGTRRGLARMEAIGCTDCHVQRLRIDRDRRVADVETAFDPDRGMLNRLFADATTLFDVVPDGDAFPKIVAQENPFVVDDLFTDFKRHDLGPLFHEREYDGSVRTAFLTEALWGVGTTPSYGHDGRSVDLEEVILRHGGEAQRSRNRYAALPDRQRRQIVEYLQSLVLFPPDDTASSLNPGDPDADPQTPAGHGSIDLGELFQIEAEGPE